MKIDIVLNHLKYQPHIEGVKRLPEAYTINVTRSDGGGLTQIEVLTALQTCIEGLSNDLTRHE